MNIMCTIRKLDSKIEVHQRLYYGHHSIGGSTSVVQYNWHERLACNQVSTSPHLSSSAAIRVMLVPFKFPGWHVELVDYENTERTG